MEPVRRTSRFSGIIKGNYPLTVGTLIIYHGLDGSREVLPVYIRRAQREKALFLCASPRGREGAEPVPLGTCFILAASGQGDQQFHYIVTAKHVLDGLLKMESIYLRVNRGDRADPLKPGEGLAYLRLEKDGWLFHPDSTVDAVVGPVDVVLRQDRNKGVGKFTLHMDRIEEILQAPDYLAQQRDTPWPPYEGEDVIFIGLMTRFQGQQTNLPIVRKGSIALVTEELIKGLYGLSQYYVINVQAYPGNSGGPVWVYYERADDGSGLHSLYYLGILVVGYPAIEELTKTSGTDPVGYYNLGVSLVTPIEKVIDIMNAKSEIERRTKAGMPAVFPGVALSSIEDEPSSSSAEFDSVLRTVSRRVTLSEPDQALSET